MARWLAIPIVVAAIMPTLSASAAEPSSGRMSASAPTVHWRGTIAHGYAASFLHFNEPQTGTAPCASPTCDTFTLEVADGHSQLAFVFASERTGDISMRVKAPDGSWTYFDGLDGKPSPQQFRLEAKQGSYTIQVSGREFTTSNPTPAEDTFDYTAAVSLVREVADQEPFTKAFRGPLKPGKSAFWNGPYIDSSGSSTASGARGADACGFRKTTCFDYEFDVAAGGQSLRLAVDHPSQADMFGIALRDPAGQVVASDTGSLTPVTDAVYSAEVRAVGPVPGRWTATVIGYYVNDSGFRVRARLERAASSNPGRRRVLEPNIRSVAPFEIAFGACQDTEVLNYGPVRCLRFSQGPENVGAGPLELTARDVGTPGADANGRTTLVGPQYQRLHYSDGTIDEVPAGTFEFHAEHHHYHHSATGGYRLYEVVSPVNGKLREAGSSPKQGYCMGDYLIAEWRSFEQDPARPWLGYLEPHNCTAPVPGGVEMRLTSGWGDIYGYGLEGQYVDFGTNPDGLYLIRATTLEDGSVTESRTDDNRSYAYIRVTGDAVEVLERGRGASPWDPKRVIVKDGRPAALTDPKCVPGGQCPA